MKTKALLTLLLGCLSFSAFSQNIPAKPTEWQAMVGLDTASHAAFIDRNSMARNKSDDGGDFSSAAILIVYKDGTQVEFRGKMIDAKSMVRHVLMDCKAAVYAPTLEFYFAMEMPTRQDRPLAAFKYTASVESFSAVTKTSPIYKALCPNYI